MLRVTVCALLLHTTLGSVGHDDTAKRRSEEILRAVAAAATADYEGLQQMKAQKVATKDQISNTMKTKECVDDLRKVLQKEQVELDKSKDDAVKAQNQHKLDYQAKEEELKRALHNALQDIYMSIHKRYEQIQDHTTAMLTALGNEISQRASNQAYWDEKAGGQDAIADWGNNTKGNVSNPLGHLHHGGDLLSLIEERVTSQTGDFEQADILDELKMLLLANAEEVAYNGTMEAHDSAFKKAKSQFVKEQLILLTSLIGDKNTDQIISKPYWEGHKGSGDPANNAIPFDPPWNDEPTSLTDWSSWCAHEVQYGRRLAAAPYAVGTEPESCPAGYEKLDTDEDACKAAAAALGIEYHAQHYMACSVVAGCVFDTNFAKSNKIAFNLDNSERCKDDRGQFVLGRYVCKKTAAAAAAPASPASPGTPVVCHACENDDGAGKYCKGECLAAGCPGFTGFTGYSEGNGFPKAWDGDYKSLARSTSHEMFSELEQSKVKDIQDQYVALIQAKQGKKAATIKEGAYTAAKHKATSKKEIVGKSVEEISLYLDALKELDADELKKIADIKEEFESLAADWWQLAIYHCCDIVQGNAAECGDAIDHLKQPLDAVFPGALKKPDVSKNCGRRLL